MVFLTLVCWFHCFLLLIFPRFHRTFNPIVFNWCVYSVCFVSIGDGCKNGEKETKKIGCQNQFTNIVGAFISFAIIAIFVYLSIRGHLAILYYYAGVDLCIFIGSTLTIKKCGGTATFRRWGTVA